MKCPKCQQVFSNELSFCLNDGSILVSDTNLAGVRTPVSDETVVINQAAKPVQKKSKWILLSGVLAVVLIFMLTGGILGLQALNNIRQEAANKPVEYDTDRRPPKDDQTGILDLNDSKTLEKLKNDGLIIVYKSSGTAVGKPNPLLLVVKIDPDSGNLKLNTFDLGNISGANTLGERLSEIFKEREKNKVFVEPSATKDAANSAATEPAVVKDVIISTKSQIKADYLYKTLNIIKKSGAKPIYLGVEDSTGPTGAENKLSGCQLPESANTQSQKITFSSMSYKLLPEGETFLKSLAEDFKQLPPDCLVEIGSHTDNVGDTESNVRLSLGRATAIKEFLVKQGVDEKKLTVRGYGSSQPKVSNDTIEGKQANRRTEFKIVTKN